MTGSTPKGPAGQFVAARPHCICGCWGARCHFCRVWVSKHDFTPEDAIACAESAPQHVCRAGSGSGNE